MTFSSKNSVSFQVLPLDVHFYSQLFQRSTVEFAIFQFFAAEYDT